MIIAAYPGCGKTTFERMCRSSGRKVIDLESNTYDLKKIEIYIDDIVKATKKYDVVLVASLKIVLDALTARKIKFTLVYPDIDMKMDFMQRYLLRNNSTAFVEKLDDSWERVIKRLDKYKNPLVTKFKLDEKHPYLTDLPGLVTNAKAARKG